MTTTTQLFCIHALCHLAQANCYFVLAITLPRHALCLSYMFRTIGVWYVVAIAIRAALYLCVLAVRRVGGDGGICDASLLEGDAIRPRHPLGAAPLIMYHWSGPSFSVDP